MLVPLLVFLFVMTVFGVIVAVVRDSGRKGYPAGYRRGHPLPPQPVRQMTPRTPRRLPPAQQLPRGSRAAPPERRPSVERPAAGTPLPGEVQRPSMPQRPATAASTEGAMRPAARTPAGEPPQRRPATQLPPAVAEGVTTAWERARYAASRVREGVAAAATSPQTKRAAQTSREALRSAATTSVETTRRLSVYTREQFDRDPRRAWMTATVIGAVLLVVVFIAIMLFSGGGGAGSPDAAGTQPTTSSRGTSTGTQVVGGAITTSTATGGAASPAATNAQTVLPGTPYSETVVLSTMQARGLAPALVNEAFTCQSPGTTPHTYRVTANGAEQRFVLLVYTDATATNKDWAIGAGRPQYRNGNCANDATVIYFNQNVLMIIPQATNPALRQQVVDAFLALP